MHRFLSLPQLISTYILTAVLIALCSWAVFLVFLHLLEFLGLKNPSKKSATKTKPTAQSKSSKLAALNKLLPQELKFRHACLIALVYFLFLLGMTYVFYHLLPNQHLPAVNQMTFVNFWHKIYLHDDGGHYFNLAQHGYRGVPEMRMKVQSPHFLLAFYPLYPFIIWLLNLLVEDQFLTALLLNFILSPLIVYWLFKLVCHQFNALTAWLTLALFLVFPWSFVIFLPYTENFFILFTILVFWFLSEKKWRLASVFGLLAALTRTPGILMVAPIGLTIFQAHRFKRPRLYLFAALPLLGTVFYLFINYLITGNPLQFITEQTLVWYQQGVQIFESLRTLALNASALPFIWQLARYGSLVFFLSLSFLTIIYAAKRKAALPYLVYAMVYLLLNFSISNPMSGARFIFALWPLLIWQAGWLSRRLYLLPICLLILFTCLIFYWALFTMGLIVC